MRKPSVNTNPTANRYSADGERIIEVSSEVGGCLISLQIRGEEYRQLFVEVYRPDEPSVRVVCPAAILWGKTRPYQEPQEKRFKREKVRRG